MRSRLSTIAAFGFLFGCSLLHAQDTDQYYRTLSQAMEAYGAVLQEIATGYVDEVDPGPVVQSGIRGMLSHLDPYSVYLVGDEQESIDRLASGRYVGFGLSLQRVNGRIVIADVRPGLPAARAGLRRGDWLVSIDGVRVDTMSVDSVRRFTRGPEGSSTALSVQRYGRPDTISVIAERERIPVANIGVVERFPGNIGYVQLEQFTRRAASELRACLDSLNNAAPLSGLILDVRNNPGGLLEAAVSASEIFLPEGSLVVSTRGRNRSSRDYTSSELPLLPSVPVVIIINDASASASEILAGALQDHDRAVVVGRRSFGKGLVQTVRTLGNGATLKLTTSRYYTPSGRCVQRDRFVSSAAAVDTVSYSTKNGRRVRASNGITPDVVVSDSSLPALVQALVDNWVVSDFATQHTSRLDAPPASFTVGPALLNTFFAFVDTVRPERLGPVTAALLRAKEAASRNRSGRKSLDQAIDRSIDRAITDVRAAVTATVRAHADVVASLLEAELAGRFLGEIERQRLLLRQDPDVSAALDVLRTSRYRSVLRGDSASDQ